MRNKKGFTLVELVIVIAVIAILAGVMIGTFSSVVSNAKKSADYQEIKQKVDEAYMEFVADGVVPQSMIITKGYYIEFSKDEAENFATIVQGVDTASTGTTEIAVATSSTDEKSYVTVAAAGTSNIVLNVSVENGTTSDETVETIKKIDSVEVVTDNVTVNVTRAILTGNNGYKFLVVLEDGSYTVTDLNTK